MWFTALCRLTAVLRNIRVVVFYFRSQMRGITGTTVCFIGEHCELEEHDGHHVLQCAWSRVKRVLTDYDFTLMPPKEQVLLL